MLGLESPSISTCEERIAPLVMGSFPQFFRNCCDWEASSRAGFGRCVGKLIFHLTAPRLVLGEPCQLTLRRPDRLIRHAFSKKNSQISFWDRSLTCRAGLCADGWEDVSATEWQESRMEWPLT